MQPIQQQLLSVDQTALILGLTPKCVWSWVHAGKIASVRVIGSRRIERTTIEQLIDDGRTCTGALPKLTKRGCGKPVAGPRRNGRPNKLKPLPVITAVQTPVPRPWPTAEQIAAAKAAQQKESRLR